MGLIAATRVKMHGKYYLPGEELPEVDAAEAARLVACGAAVGLRAVPGPSSETEAVDATKTAKATKDKGNEEAKDTAATAATQDVPGPELPPEKPIEEMTANELRAELEELDVTFNPKASKAELLKLLQDVHASADAF